MDLNTFRKFTLIDVLDQKIHRHQSTIESEQARIVTVENQREIRIQQRDHATDALKTTKELLSGEESELFNIDQNLEKSRINLTTAIKQQQLDAIEKEIESLGPKKEDHEIIILELMEKIESLEDGIKVADEFLTGSETTLSNIRKEVAAIVSVEQKEITSSEEEAARIFVELNPSDRELLQLTLKRYRFNTPMLKIVDGSCRKCGSVIDRLTASQVEKAVSIEMCSGCNRILLPSIL